MANGIHQAILAIMREIGPIGKDSTNEQQHYKYRSIEAVYNRVQPLFAKYGVFSYPKVLEQTRETGTTHKGGRLQYAILTVEYTFAAEDGSSIPVTVIGEGMDSGDKASNKALAAAHKYAICQVLNIPYQLVDPDKTSPDWAAAKHAKELNELKRAWAEQQGDELDALDKTERAERFQRWGQEVLGTLATYELWTREQIRQCMKALTDTPTKDLDYWLSGVRALESLESCAEFQREYMPTVPEQFQETVQRALNEREKGLTK